jgi:hypothetical protein
MRRERGMSYLTAGLIGLAVVACVTYLRFAKRFPWAQDYEIKAIVTQAYGATPPCKVAPPLEFGGARRSFTHLERDAS